VLIGNLHFSSVELSDTRTARPYVCIVQNSALGKLVQGDDQIVVTRQGSGIDSCENVCRRASIKVAMTRSSGVQWRLKKG